MGLETLGGAKPEEELKKQVKLAEEVLGEEISSLDTGIDSLDTSNAKIAEPIKTGKEGKKEWTLETLQADVRAKGIKFSSEYSQNAYKNGWPNPPVLTLIPGFPRNPDGSKNWDAFLGREKRPVWTFETLQADVKAKGIKTAREYAEKGLENKWPTVKTLTSMSKFPKNPDGSNDWDTYLGREKKKVWTFETLQEDVRKKKIKSSEDYNINAAKNNWPNFTTLTSMPEFPKKDGSNNWGAFLYYRKKKN